MRQPEQKLIFELSQDGRIGHALPELDIPEVPVEDILADECIRKEEPGFQRFLNFSS